MTLKDYFDSTKGYCVFSTSNKYGSVNAAVYSRPHVMEDGTLAVIMNNKLSHANVSENPNAHLLFIEEGKRYKGKRLSLSKVREEQDTELLFELCRRCKDDGLEPEGKTRFLVFFKVEKELPLIGTNE